MNGEINEKKIERGLLICFEGIEGSGKTTQIEKLIDYFKSNKEDYFTLNFPCKHNNLQIFHIYKYICINVVK